jgi:hypothetical protein
MKNIFFLQEGVLNIEWRDIRGINLFKTVLPEGVNYEIVFARSLSL